MCVLCHKWIKKTSSERQLLVASAWSQRPCLATPGLNSGDRNIFVHSAPERGEKAPRLKKKVDKEN
jgi:hypothetical protein